MKYGIIAGNGRFPVLALETARKQGDEAVAFAIREEAGPEVEGAAAHFADAAVVGSIDAKLNLRGGPTHRCQQVAPAGRRPSH